MSAAGHDSNSGGGLLGQLGPNRGPVIRAQVAAGDGARGGALDAHAEFGARLTPVLTCRQLRKVDRLDADLLRKAYH